MLVRSPRARRSSSSFSRRSHSCVAPGRFAGPVIAWAKSTGEPWGERSTEPEVPRTTHAGSGSLSSRLFDLSIPMPLDRSRAWTQLCEWTETPALRNHARAVEVVMRAAALRYGGGEADVERFGIAGMLHDADYEKWPE